jgi:outer membrane protein OmpA-like peptidoglycan-associated protein
MKKVILLVISLVILSACTSTDPYTRTEKYSNSSKYALGGAVAGAIAGQIAGKDTKGTVIGAVVGGAAGAGYGAYLDKQEAILREKLEGTGVYVERSSDNTLKLIMPGNVTFATNSYDINGSFYDVLDSIALVLKKYEDTKISVVGYTDNTGSMDYNQKLSEKRAQSVSNYLSSQGVSQDRVYTAGMGIKNPISDNSTSEGRSKNRRVEIEIVGGAA